MSEPLAYFLTWVTYGTWLHGDERGWVNKRCNCYGADLAPPNETLLNYSQSLLKHDPVTLNHDERLTVESAIAEVCKYKGWELLACSCRSNHVHVVVRAGDIPPKVVASQLKAYATRALKSLHSLEYQNFWAKDGSNRQIFTDEGIEKAIYYVQHQDDHTEEP